MIKIYTMIKTLVIDKHDQNITMIKNDLARYYLNDLKIGTYIRKGGVKF